MNLRYLQFAAVMLWGIQTDLLYFALPMGILLEARFFVNRRWALARQDFYRIADLTTVVMGALILFLFLNRIRYPFITTLVEWLPVIFFPLVVVLAYSTTEKMPLDVVFYSLRRQSQPVGQSWDMNYVFFGICLVAAGTNTERSHFYMIAVSSMVLVSLFRLRSPRYERNICILVACAIFISAWFTQLGLHAGHEALKERTREWLANYIRSRTDPLRTRSSIGTIGRLKVSDAIAFRVASDSKGAVPSLLQEATYDLYSDDNWMVLNPHFAEVPHEDDFKWRLATKTNREHRVRIWLEFDDDVSIVPVPTDTTEISDLPATDIRRSRFGSIEGVGLVASPGYEVSYRPGADIDGPPGASDRYVPPNYVQLLERVASTSPLRNTDPVARVRDILRTFRYSLYQDMAPAEDPLRHFLLTSKSGHCEYFATATVLLLRYLGVPARYAVGYSVQEFDPGLGMFIVRERHAHAWAIAWLGGRWQVVDTTPSIWKTAEAQQSNPLRPALDAVANATFLFQVWWNKQRLEDYRVELYVAGALLLLVLVWRIATSEQVVLDRSGDGASHRHLAIQGANSPFYRIESHLEASGLARHPGEVFGAWLNRIGKVDLLPLLHAHNRLRFDPRGVPEDAFRQLDEKVSAWLEQQQST